MKQIIALCVLLAATSAFAGDPNGKSCCSKASLATCKPLGQGTCRACKNCKYCAHCNAGGKCSVCAKTAPKKIVKK